MATQNSRVTIAKPVRANGVLAVPASATQRGHRPNTSNNIPRAPSAPAARHKILVRRLPPGLTQAEFEEALGEEWKPGGEKIGWADYKPGKISKDLAKPSRPSRAYLHLKKAEYAGPLGDKVRSTGFNDVKNSSNDSCLLGPPSVEFAPFQKVPSARPRKDARQSTIDQDPEFIDFLESLTNPIPKTNTVDQENESMKSKDRVTVTPLIQFLKDKKASKGKEASSTAKGSRHGRSDTKDSKSSAAASNKSPAPAASSNKKRSAQAVKVEQAARDAVKALNKQAANVKGSLTPSPAPAPSPPARKEATADMKPSSTATAALAEKKRERGSASAAAKILQRDLGLGGSPGMRGGRGARSGRTSTAGGGQQQTSAKTDQTTQQNAKASANTTVSTGAAPTESATTTETKPSPTILQKPAAPPTGPAASRASSASKQQQQQQQQQKNPKAVPHPSTSTQAFLKHANPSQGISEPLLEEAFAVYGRVLKVEIDKKKGFAYVNFETAESLQKAIKASPIKVAQGQVVVLERKTGPSLQARNTSGGGGGGGGSGGRGGSPMAGSGTRSSGAGDGGSGVGGGGGRGGTPNNPRNGNVHARSGNTRVRGGMNRAGNAAQAKAAAATSPPAVSATPAATAAPAQEALPARAPPSQLAAENTNISTSTSTIEP